MKIVHISKNEKGGGAARATNRIHQQLLNLSIDSKMLVMNKETYSKEVIKFNSNSAYSFISTKIDSILIRLLGTRKHGFFSSGLLGVGNLSVSEELNSADIIGLYWLSNGFVSIFEISRILKLDKPVIWRLSDMWPFTSGLHYTNDAKKLSYSLFLKWFDILITKYKIKYWDLSNLTVICPSKWIESEARKSRVFREANIVYLPTGVDFKIFNSNQDKKEARNYFSLPLDKKLILFGAVNSFDDSRKGSDLLIEALISLAASCRGCLPEIVIFGSDSVPNRLSSLFKCHLLGHIKKDCDLAKVYRASDVFVAPSREENLANTILESLACNTPCVAFSIGGMPDVIKHMINGYLATPFDVDDLAKGIIATISSEFSDERGDSSLLDVCFSQEAVINAYINIYKTKVVK